MLITATEKTINSTTPGRLRLLLVDITQNANRFEYKTSDSILRQLDSSGVSLASPKVVRPTSAEEYRGVFSDPTIDFNAVLLFAHGGPDPGDGRVSEIDAPDRISNWYTLASQTDNMEDKFLALCVCCGFCEDAITAFVNQDPFALTLLAPTDSLTVEEAIDFFPPFFAELARWSSSCVDPDYVRKSMRKFNKDQAHNKMAIYSDGLSEEDKITEYLLNPQHRFGASKARFFALFGFCTEEWAIMAEALREHGSQNEASKVKETGYGPRYEVEGELSCPDGRRPRVRTVWQKDKGRIAQRLITAYPLEEL